MKKIILLFMVFCLILTGCIVSCAAGDTVRLQFLLVNDFHGHIRQEGNAPGAGKLAGTIERLQKDHPGATILLGGGDMFAGTLDSNEFHGRPAIEVMNTLGFDADVAGNHIFDFDGKVIRQQAKWAHFPLLAANIRPAVLGTASPFQDGILIERDGIKIGIVGATTMETPVKATKSNMIDFTFIDPAQPVQQSIDRLKQQGAQIIVLLAHMATVQDADGTVRGDELAALLKQLHGVDIIFSGHSHEIVAGAWDNRPVLQSGWAGQHVAGLLVTYDKTQQKIQSTVPFMTTPAGASDTALEQRLQRFIRAVDAKYHTTLTMNAQLLDNDRWMPSSPCADVLTDILRQETGADIVLYNGGAFRTSLPAGPLTMARLLDVLPFRGSLLMLQLSGSDIRKAIAHGLDNKNYGFIRFSGLNVKGCSVGPESERVQSITLTDGTPLSDTKTYSVVTTAFMYGGGDGYTMLKNGTDMKNKGSETAVLKRGLARQATLIYVPNNRLEILAATEAIPLKKAA